MLSDLTFEMCVPSLRCKAAQRMHKKMPNCICQYCVPSIDRFDVSGDGVGFAARKTYTPTCPSCALVSLALRVCTFSLPGFFAPQSAHVPFPGTVLISSCSVRSLRACWRLLRAEAMLSHCERHLGPQLSLAGAVERAYAAGARGRDGEHVAQHQLSICAQEHFSSEPYTSKERRPQRAA